MNAPIIIANHSFPAVNRRRQKMTSAEITAIVGQLTPAQAKAETQRLWSICENMADIWRASTGAVKHRASDRLAADEITTLFAELDLAGRRALWHELAVRAAMGAA